ncbi:MAG: hypothetical protein PUB69_05030 [Desulfovibrionaceae bacterium]|nr:hypothetical protein [Desulfovibrionaceae bacterium]
MAKPIRMFKLISGEIVIGKYDEESGNLEDLGTIEIAGTASGPQMMLIPYGYPFEQEFSGSVHSSFFMYEFTRIPEGLDTQYLEACSKLSIARSSGLYGTGGSGGNPAGGSGLITGAAGLKF